MKRILIFTALLALASYSWGAFASLAVTGATVLNGDVTLGDAAGDAITVNGTMALQEVTALPVGAVGAPSWYFAGSATTGYYQTAADEIGITIAGVNEGTWSAAGLASVTGFTGAIGLVAPNTAVFTTVQGTDATFTGDFEYGQVPGDLHTGYRRTETIKYIDGFDVGNDADLAVRWNIAGVVGAGTNDETTTDGWNTLITGGAGGPDMESTVSNGLHLYRAYAPRLECVVDLTAVAAGQTFYFGFYAAANEFAEIIHEPATSPNWLVRVDDTGGATTHDTGIVAAAGTPTKLEIWVDAAGAVNAAIDDVDVACAGLDPMTANPHYVEWRILDVAAAAHTVAIDYFISEQLKLQ
jgi:hypothetical protein